MDRNDSSVDNVPAKGDGLVHENSYERPEHSSMDITLRHRPRTGHVSPPVAFALAVELLGLATRGIGADIPPGAEQPST